VKERFYKFEFRNTKYKIMEVLQSLQFVFYEVQEVPSEAE
jgi:hypothetical protein